MSLTQSEYSTLAALLSHQAVIGMGAVGRDAVALLPKVQALAEIPDAPAPVGPAVSDKVLEDIAQLQLDLQGENAK